MNMRNRLEAPASFSALAMRFHADTGARNEEALVDSVVAGLSAAERLELSDFLDRVLSLPDAGSVFKALWKRSQSDLRFRSSAGARLFFATIRSRL